MSIARTLRRVLASTCLVLLVGCIPGRGGASDPDKALLYLHLAAADLALFADSSFEAGADWDLMAADVKDMQAAARAMPAGDRRKAKAEALVEQASRLTAEFEKAMPEVAAAQQATAAFTGRTFQSVALWDEVIRGMAENGAPISQVLIANRQIVLTDRMSRRASEILEGGDRAITAADALARDLAVHGEVIKALRSGNAEIGIERAASVSQPVLEKLQALQAEQDADSQRLLTRLSAILTARDAVVRLSSLRFELLEAAPPKYSPPAG